MKRACASLRAGLSAILALQLAAPLGTWPTQGSRDLQVEQLQTGATLWVLAVGVSTYADPRINLRYADNDAQRIAQALQTQQGILFHEVMVQVLVNGQATREEILKSMSQFLGQAGPKDVVVIFMAGHGLQDRQTGTYYFVPYNANAENLVYAGLPMPMFEEAVKRLRANVNRLVLWMDTCHAGAVNMAARSGVSAGEDLAEALQQASGQYVLSASKAGEESLENDAYRFENEDRAHGAFTYSLLKGLRGEAADSSNVVWLGDLFSHVSKEVPRLTTGKQHPYSQMQGTDLPLFVMDATALARMDQAFGKPVPVDSQSLTTSVLPVAKPDAKRSGSRRWIWLLLGVAVAGGGAALGLSGGGDAGGQTPIPLPPSHP